MSFGELQDLSNKFANVLAAHGVERGDRVATLLPSLPETAAVVPRHLQARRDPALDVGALRRRGHPAPAARLGRARLVTDAANRDRIPDGLVEHVLVLDGGPGGGDGGGLRRLRRGRHRRPRTRPSSTTRRARPGMAKGILHAHRYLLAHEEFEFCHDVQDGELFHGMGEWAWAAGHLRRCSARGATARRRWCTRARAASTPTSSCASSPSTACRACSPRPPRCAR